MLVFVVVSFGFEAMVWFYRIQLLTHQFTAGAHHVSYHSQL